ncbi:MAG: hypothetical protein B6D46_02150 [Polyangiaceae bacterium UTPRO1]|jgi:hypothetical protein|nr:hypothetical protein [Myxococcales bacterium]OQY68922.1 MAG: hypothetical protein B6D46_02150 [Polyangiaceae bacterium UTPRO1]
MKILLAVVLAYVAVVAAFESLLGFFQPVDRSTLVLTTFDPDGSAHERVVARLDTDGRVYVSANHWPRAWYRRALAHPEVQAIIDGRKGNYRVVAVTGAEAERVEREHPHKLWFRVVTGFPPRAFLRLDPR